MNKIIQVAVHNGIFHADEVFACAAISCWYKDKVQISRVDRNENLDVYDYVVDIGGKHDGVKFFDHHQREFTLARPNGVKYSSFGLIWLKLGLGVCDGDTEVFTIVDKQLVEPIDAHDNGQAGSTGDVTLSNIISLHNPTWDMEVDDSWIDTQFSYQMNFAKGIIEGFVKKAKALVKAKEIVKSAKAVMDGKVLVLERFAPWQGQVSREFPQVEFVVFPDIRSGWRLQAVPDGSYGNQKKNKKNLPAVWGGLSGQILAEVTGVQGVTFCHAGLFICGTDNKEAILKMAELAVRHTPEVGV